MSTAHDTAERSLQWADWAAVDASDERAIWDREGSVIAARHEDLERNNPVAAATVGYLISSVLGPEGLTFRSTYQADPAVVTDEDKADRAAITRWVQTAMGGTRWDAAGRCTTRDLLAQVLWCSLLPGNGISIRVRKPNRPGNPRTAWCARVIHPARVSNPHHRANSDRLANGWTLDADGDPVTMHVKTSRTRLAGGQDRWTDVPVWGEDGLRNVCHLAAGFHPDRLMGYGFLRSVAGVLKIEDSIRKTYLVAKQIQASFPLIIETDDTQTIRAAMARNCFLGEGTRKFKLLPNQVYFCKKGAIHHFTDTKFNGADMAAFSDHLIGVACAAVELPQSVVMKRLGRASLAAARAELADAWRTTLVHRQRLLDYTLRPWTSWAIEEGRLRGEIAVANPEPDRLFAGSFLGASMPSPDRLKDMQAAAELRRLGASRSTSLASVGITLEDELHREAADRELEFAVLGDEGLPDPATARSAPPPPGTDDDEMDDQDDQDDDQDDDQQPDDTEEQQTDAA